MCIRSVREWSSFGRMTYPCIARVVSLRLGDRELSVRHRSYNGRTRCSPVRQRNSYWLVSL